MALTLFALARKRLAQLTAEEAEAAGHDVTREALADFIPRVQPGYERPAHLAPLLTLLDRVRAGEEVRAVVSAPPRHAKTETLLAAYAWLLATDAKRAHAYATYEANLSRAKSRLARTLATAAGVRMLDDRPGRLADWRTAAGGGLLATSVGGPFTGQGVNGLLVIDDPIKNRMEAESRRKREAQWQWFTDVAYTRLEPGASVIVTMARWHEDDLAGRALKQGGEFGRFEHVNLPAISDEGLALWPERRSLLFLQERREKLGPYSWASLYEGRPRPRGGRVFNGCEYTDELPRGGYRVAIGLDLAYTEKTRADWSVAVVLAHKEGKFYVLHVLREQVEAPAFADKLRSLLARYPGVRPWWYASGTEKGTGQFLRRLGVPVVVKPAVGDKFQRAQPVAAAWNGERVLVPGDADRHPWAAGFVERVGDFTGAGGSPDTPSAVPFVALHRL